MGKSDRLLVSLIERMLQKMCPNYEPDLFHVIWEDTKKGELAWYTAKYAIKRDDIFRSSWYFTHSIKRINFFGIPPGHKWSEVESKENNKDYQYEQYAINLYNYICANGGLGVKSKNYPKRLSN